MSVRLCAYEYQCITDHGNGNKTSQAYTVMYEDFCVKLCQAEQQLLL